MKKTQFIELANNIKKTLVSFISITIFIAMGIAIFCGISWSSTAVDNDINKILNQTNFHDIELIFPYGMDGNDLTTLKQIEGVDEVEASYVTYNYFELNDTKYQIKLIELHENIDIPFEIEGSLPTKIGELALDKEFAKKNDIHIGDKIKLNSDNDGNDRLLAKIMNYDSSKDSLDIFESSDDEKMSHLKTDSFIVTALVKNSEYLSSNTNNYGIALTNKQIVNCYGYLAKASFDENSYMGYTDIFIRSNTLREHSTFSDEYSNKIEIIKDRINSQIVNKLLEEKSDKLNQTINNLDLEFNNKLQDGKKQIDDGKKKIIDGQSALNTAKQQLEEAKITLEQGQTELDEAIAKYNTAKNEYDEYVLSVKKIANMPIIGKQINDYLAKQKQLLDDGLRKIEQGQSQLKQGRKAYEDKLVEYDKQVSLLNQGKKDIEEAEKEYEDYVHRYNKLKEKIPENRKIEGTVLTREFNPSFAIGQQLINSLEKIRFSMASLFLIVGLLVCYSALSRIINDQAILIGTKKALGLSDSQITISYLMYTGICLLFGCVLGVVLAYFVVEKILVNSVSDSFIINFNSIYEIKSLITIWVVHIILLLLTSYIACASILKRKPVDLLTNSSAIKTKKHLIENTKLWQKLPLFGKTIINNCLNDSRRVFGTIVGIAGSTALIVTALTLNNNIANSFKLQYDKYYHFDTIINFDANNEEAYENVKKVLDDCDVKAVDIFFTRMYNITPDNSYIMSYLFIPTNEKGFDSLISLEKHTNLDGDITKGCWLPLAYYNFYKPLEKDSTTLLTSSGKRADIIPEGYFKYYLINCQNYMDKKTYEETYEEEVLPNAFIVDTSNIDKQNLNSKLKKTDGYLNTIDYYDTTYEAFYTIKKVSNAVVVIYMTLSIVMAFLVLLNIMILFINEKKKELIIMMINGFSIKQAKKYIYSDTIFLATISIIIGICIGVITGNLSVFSFENCATIFLHKVDIFACIVGALGSGILTVVISLISLKKIDKFVLSEIND